MTQIRLAQSPPVKQRIILLVETRVASSPRTGQATSLQAERTPIQTQYYPILIAVSGAWKATL